MTERPTGGIVLPEPPPPPPTFDEWLEAISEAHQECICDVTEIFRHCKVCPTNQRWPCYTRRLVDGYRAQAEGGVSGE